MQRFHTRKTELLGSDLTAIAGLIARKIIILQRGREEQGSFRRTCANTHTRALTHAQPNNCKCRNLSLELKLVAKEKENWEEGQKVWQTLTHAAQTVRALHQQRGDYRSLQPKIWPLTQAIPLPVLNLGFLMFDPRHGAQRISTFPAQSFQI